MGLLLITVDLVILLTERCLIITIASFINLWIHKKTFGSSCRLRRVHRVVSSVMHPLGFANVTELSHLGS